MTAAPPPIGTLRDRVQLQARTAVPDGAGGETLSFVPLATVWARVYARPANLTAFADARGVAATHAVTLRYRAGLSPGDRIVWGGRTLEILSAEDLNGRRAYLSCTCSELRGTG